MRLHLVVVQIDSRQDDLVIPDRDNEITVILPNLYVPVIVLAWVIIELQLIDPELEVGDRRVNPALSPNDECIRPAIAGHGHVAARCHQRVI